MAPRDEDLRTALEMVPINILRRMIEERNLNFKSRRSDELIERLIEDGWSDDDFEELKTRLADIQLEKLPYSRYMSEIDAIDPRLGNQADGGRVPELLEMNESNFDDDHNLIDPGFEVTDSSGDSLKGIHWTRSINYTLTPLKEIKKEHTLYETGFEFDFQDDVIFIDCTLPAKARGLLAELEELSIRTRDVGHANLANQKANEHVLEFVDQFIARLEEEDPQASVAGAGSRTVLEVDLVNILLDEAVLKDVKIGGRTDIMENEEVQRFLEDHDSRIVRLEGQFNLSNTWYNFVVGYTDGMGNVSVKKKGTVEERPDLVEAGFEFIYETFREHFIDV